MAHSPKKIKTQNFLRLKNKMKEVNSEIKELSDHAEGIVRQIRDLAEDADGFQCIDELVMHTIHFYQDLIEHLEELHMELQQVRMFASVALLQKTEIQKKLSRSSSL